MSPCASPSPPRSGGVRTGFFVFVVVLAIAAALAVTLDRSRWHVRLVDMRFVDHPEKLAGGGAALDVTGYLVVRGETHRDIFKLSRDENSRPEVQATSCDSGQPLGAWRDPLPLERDVAQRRFVYAVLIPARHHDLELAQAGEVCLHLLAVGANLAPWAQSRPLALSLPADVREQMLAYGRRKGAVDMSLDAGCAPRLCQPE